MAPCNRHRSSWTATPAGPRVSASWRWAATRKPKPLDRPVSRSMMTCADWTVPCAANSCSSALLVTSKDKFPTYNFLPIDGSPERKAGRRRPAAMTQRVEKHYEGQGIGREDADGHRTDRETQVPTYCNGRPAPRKYDFVKNGPVTLTR